MQIVFPRNALITINPLDAFLWTVRKNEKDVINLYNTLTPVMQLATGGTMLNFGYWTDGICKPIAAQENLCRKFGTLAELKDAKVAVDVGSGLSGPAMFWHSMFPNLGFYCVNTNFAQLQFSGHQPNTEFLNSTATKMPFLDRTVDRVLALESSQHFKPYADFVSESRRILKPSGMLVLALPVTFNDASIRRLGVLKFTWSSEHYRLNHIQDILESGGFEIAENMRIGKLVYVPLAEFYIKHRSAIKKSIQSKYPSYVERILFWSIQKMKKAAMEGIIDYVLLKCTVR